MEQANAFVQFFQNSLNDPPPIGMVMKYNALRTSKQYERFVFVEGSSDAIFYGKAQVADLSDNSAYVYQTYQEGNGGKESVFYAYNQIKNNKDLLQDFNRCVYIVDRDWDLTIRSKNKWVSKKDETRITLTLGHSMECYFLEDNNVRTIFEEFNISEHYDNFINTYQEFIYETVNYWALKSTVIFASKMNISCRYKKQYSFDDIFSYDFRKQCCYEIDKLLVEEENMLSAIEKNSDLMRYYEKWKKKISEEPRFIRGHDAFNFLFAYINYVSKKRITVREIFDLVDKLQINLEVRI